MNTEIKYNKKKLMLAYFGLRCLVACADGPWLLDALSPLVLELSSLLYLWHVSPLQNKLIF